MGLDITAYSRLTPVGFHEKDPELNEGDSGGDWCYYEGHVQAFAYARFPQSFRGVPVLRTIAGGVSIVEGGCFEVTDESRSMKFRAGSYGSYSEWRDDLQRQFNPGIVADMPFYELIHFAGNEGCIGPEAARDLLEDFRTHFERYMPPAEDRDWFLDKYKSWMKAFEAAADGGLVEFR